MVESVSVRLKSASMSKNAFKHSYTVECGNRLCVGVHAKNASLSGFACWPFKVKTRVERVEGLQFVEIFQKPLGAHFWRGFLAWRSRSGWNGPVAHQQVLNFGTFHHSARRRWRSPQNTAKIVPQKCVLLLIRKKGAEKRPESMVWEGFPCATTPSVLQPLFETSERRVHKSSWTPLPEMSRRSWCAPQPGRVENAVGTPQQRRAWAFVSVSLTACVEVTQRNKPFYKRVLLHSILAAPPIFTTLWTPLWGKIACKTQGNCVSAGFGTTPYFWTIHLRRRNVEITSQKLSWNYLWALWFL